MAFCPNCGTPNTDQAEKCVSCGFELAPKQKAKFKGTIMMSGVQAPTAKPPEGAPQAPPAAAPTPQPFAPAQPQPGGPKNLAFEKTMMGPMAGLNNPGGTQLGMPQAPAASPYSPPAGGQAGGPTNDFSRAATVEGPAPQFAPPAAQGNFAAPAQNYAPAGQASAAQAPAGTMGGGGGYSGSSTGNFGGGGGTGNFGGGGGTGGFGGDSMAPPAVPKSNTGKILAIGCAAVLVLSCVIGGLLFFVAKEKFMSLVGGIEKEGEALEWRSSLAQSLTQVAAMCQTDCQSAAVYFHPNVQAALLPEAKALNSAGLTKLMDITQSEARMLGATDDASLATNLGLDPQQCVRIVSGTAKVVGCSVPDPNGAASLRIVHMSGLSSL